MKKLFVCLISMVAAFPVSVSAAAGNHPMGGCGLGYILFGKSHPTGTVQITAFTTNQSLGNQVFGITSGTSGCTPEGAVAINKQTERFVEVNYESLRSDIAKGQGEYVKALIDLLGVKDTKKSATLLLLKTDYADLFPTQETRFDEFLKNLQQKLAEHIELLA